MYEIRWQNQKEFPGRELNPGLLRDRQGYSPLYYREGNIQVTSKSKIYTLDISFINRIHSHGTVSLQQRRRASRVNEGGRTGEGGHLTVLLFRHHCLIWSMLAGNQLCLQRSKHQLSVGEHNELANLRKWRQGRMCSETMSWRGACGFGSRKL